MPPKRPPTKLVDPKKWNGVPSVLKLLLVKLVACLAECARGNVKRDVDLVEIFAGERALTFAVQNQGYVAEGCDILLDPTLHDILSDEGMEHLCKLVLRIKPGGILWGALPCKSWVWISRNGTGRCVQNPGGFTYVPRIAEANQQVEHFVALATLAYLRDVDFVVENPKSSLIFKYEPLSALMTWSKGSIVNTYMGAFASNHCKPLMLGSSWAGIAGMSRAKPSGSEPLAERRGNAVNGRSKELTQSAAYTQEFGEAFADLLSTKLAPHGKQRPAMKRPAAAAASSAASSHTTTRASSKITLSGSRVSSESHSSLSTSTSLAAAAAPPPTTTTSSTSRGAKRSFEESYQEVMQKRQRTESATSSSRPPVFLRARTFARQPSKTLMCQGNVHILARQQSQ